MYKVILAGSVSLLIAACATTPKTVSTQATQQQGIAVTRGTSEAGDQLICTDSYPIGSHIPQRICLTKAQMEARQKAAQTTIQTLQSQAKESSGCAPSCML